MSRTRIVGGSITKTSKGATTIEVLDGNFISSAAKQNNWDGGEKGITHYDYVAPEKKEEKEEEDLFENDKLIADVKNGEDFPEIKNTSGKKLLIKFFISTTLKIGKEGFNSLSYGVAFKKLNQGFIMGSNGKTYQKLATKFVKDLADSKEVNFYRAKDFGNKYFTTKTVNQIEAFRSTKLQKWSKLAGKAGDNAGYFLTAISFLSSTIEKGEPDAIPLLDAALPTLVAGGNPFAGLILAIMKTQIKNDINEFNAYIAKHLEEVETQKGVVMTQYYIKVMSPRFKIVTEYKIYPFTPTAMAAYLSGQAKTIKELNAINAKSPIEEWLTESMLIRNTDEGQIVKTIFLNDKYAEQKQ
ncbi:hypothetical protein NTJ12_002418 [Flavobacterium psychrophilum]|nr:hypothetical protein [Flavobacterium psychrophilum]